MVVYAIVLYRYDDRIDRSGNNCLDPSIEHSGLLVYQIIWCWSKLYHSKNKRTPINIPHPQSKFNK